MNEQTQQANGTAEEKMTWLWWVIRLVVAAVGLLYLSASVMKAAEMPLFFRQIKAYGIVTDPLLITLGAWGLVAVECALGAGLLMFYRPRWTIPLTGMLSLVFLGATTYAWLTGITDDCGCFGAWMKQTPKEEAFQNIVLLCALAAAWAGRSHWHAPRTRAKDWVFAVACLLGLALPWPFGFPISAMINPQAEGTRTEIGRVDIAGVSAVDLHRGRHLVFLMGTDCQHCLELLPEIEMLAEGDGLPPVLGLCPNTEEDRIRFIDEFQPLFPLGRIGENTFFRLLGPGDTPRVMLVDEGVVKQTWEQVVPTREELQAVLAS